MADWIDTPTLAGLTATSERKCRKALELAHAQIRSTWRGAALTVRTVRGRGGRSGLRYEVLVSSLPFDLQERFKAAEKLDAGVIEPVAASSAEREWWHTILLPALQHPKHSRQRGAAIAAILARPLTDWTGRPISPSRRTIERQLDAYQLHGVRALGRLHRRDKGKAKVLISKVWDDAVPLDEEARQHIATSLRSYIRGLYKADTSAKLIQALACAHLAKLTAQADRRSVSDELRAVCRVPRAFIEAERNFRKVAILNKDRKTHEDARPRISRHREGLNPMDVVFGDVHRLDIVMRREDGSTAHPRAIAWLDAATNRLRFDLVLPPKGEDVRNADLIRSFITMTQDPTWGMPARLYIDNGKEYGFADFLDDALKLVSRGAMQDIRDASSAITNARAYNAQAKPIEGLFGRLEQNYFRTIPGWTDGDRMKKRTASVGKPTEPFDGTLEDLARTLQAFLKAYSMLPQRRQLKGKSPDTAYNEAIRAGWQRTTFNADELRVIFSTQETRIVRQGVISFDGRKWTCDELHTYLGSKVTVCAPKYESATRLPLLDDGGALLGFAMPERDYALMDPAGARESARRDRAHKGAIQKLARRAPDIDVNAEIMNFAASAPPLPAAPVAGTVSLSAETAAIAQGISEDPRHREDTRHQSSQREGRKRLATLEGALKRIAGGRG